ncbi:MAG TPA: DNA primase [Thermoplasmatales archaeon]|nr:DNA primase [Thermoplasmatales archaeon]
MLVSLDPSAAKYLIKGKIMVDGVVDKSDVIGAIFGQTEGLMGEELDLRDLQKSARIGRIEVELKQNQGKSEGELTLTSALEKVETAIISAAIESVDRIGPCKAEIKVEKVEDIRISKRKKLVERAKEILQNMIKQSKEEMPDLAEEIKQTIQVEEISYYGKERLPAGPNIDKSDAIIIVEGRNDVINLLKHGIKNAIAVEGTNIPQTIIDLCNEKIATAFVDGDRGGELILRELLQVADVDFVARAPPTREVEELTYKLIMKTLKNKIPADQYMDSMGMKKEKEKEKPKKKLEGEFALYKKLLEEVKGNHNAVFLDEKNKEIKRVKTEKLIQEIEKEKPNVVIFDGIITQRLIDNAFSNKVKKIVATTLGEITKIPKQLKILTASQFE